MGSVFSVVGSLEFQVYNLPLLPDPGFPLYISLLLFYYLLFQTLIFCQGATSKHLILPVFRGFLSNLHLPLLPGYSFASSSVMAARILANLIIMGSGILARGIVQAYRQALANASKSGVAQETVQNIRRASKVMAEPEARQILGVSEQASWEEILQKYDNLFEQNAKNGSFYLQSKVHRAKECLEEAYQKKAEGPTGV